MGFVLPEMLRENDELVADLARFSENLLSEKIIRRKYGFDEETWVGLAEDELFSEMVEAERIRRIRNGAAKRESAQALVATAPAVLGKIMNDERQSAKHRIHSAKTLDQLAGFTPETAEQEDRVHIVINLGGDEKLVIDAPVKPKPPGDTIIDNSPAMITANNQVDQQELIPAKRGPGRPKGSRNKPKTNSTLLGFTAVTERE
jgi:hypothetical protein